MAKGTQITAQRARERSISPQGKNESDEAFRNRVSGELRNMGLVVEAHEAYQNALYDDPNGSAMTGILGAVAQELSGNRSNKTGSTQVGDDIAAGVVSIDDRPKLSAEEALLLVLLSGGKRR